MGSLAIALLNHLLEQAPWARVRLAPHGGKSAAIEAGFARLRLSVAADGFFAEDLGEVEPTVRITLPATSPADWVKGVDSVMRAARIHGEVEFADTLGFVLRHLRWDAEADLARIFGDIAAHRLHSLGRSALAGTGKAVSAVEGNLREFAIEGRMPFVARSESEDRAAVLRGFRDALGRLEKRIDRL